MKLHFFTAKTPLSDGQTSQGWKSDFKVYIKHDDLYAKARECGIEKRLFDNDRNEPNQLKSREIKSTI